MEEQNVLETTESPKTPETPEKLPALPSEVPEVPATPEISVEMGEETPAAPERSGEMPQDPDPAPAPDPEAEIAQRIADAVAEERTRWEAELSAQREALAREQQMGERLRQAGLDVGFANLLCGQNAEQDGARFETFQKLYRQAVQEGVLKQLRVEELPKVPQKPKVYDRETLRTMRPEEINARWAEIAGQLKRNA